MTKQTNNMHLVDFPDDIRVELEERREEAEKRLKYYLQKVNTYRQLIENFNGILSMSQHGKDNREQSGSANKSSDLTPTEFVVEILNKSPDRWISIQEFLYKGRIAFKSGEVKIRSGKIENSIHSVLTRFRKKNHVWTKGHRETRKYKLKK